MFERGSAQQRLANLAMQYSTRGVRRFIRIALVVGSLVLPGCSASGGDGSQSESAGQGQQIAVQSITTDLNVSACRKEIDKSDPNETPYLRCPGVGGYSLILRRVEAGRTSIDVVDPDQHVFPL